MIRNKLKNGFTLIELMSVIAIIAILSAVLIPTISGYINRSKKKCCYKSMQKII